MVSSASNTEEGAVGSPPSAKAGMLQGMEKGDDQSHRVSDVSFDEELKIEGGETAVGGTTLHTDRLGSKKNSSSWSDISTYGSPATKPTFYCYMLTLMSCLNSCNLGYDVGSVGGAALLMQEQFGWSRWELGLFVGTINFFSIFGAMNAGLVCDALGRRKTFTVSCAIFIIGIIAQISSESFPAAMFGRVFVGIGVGLGLAIDPLYISEISPPAHRGHLVSFAEIFINFGIMLGFIADYAFLNLPLGVNWRVMLGLGIVMPSLLIILSITVMPESPRWLLLRGRREEAMAVLKKTYPEGSDLDLVADDISQHIKQDEEESKMGSWGTVLCPSPIVRRMLLAGIGLAACQQINGTESVIYFSPQILESAGFESRTESFAMTILIGCSKMIFTLVAVLYSDRFGRRPLLLLSNAGLFGFLVLMGSVTTYPSLAPVMTFAMCGFMASFSLAMGPLCWAGAAEVFPTRIRARAMSLATSANRLISGTVAMTTLPLMAVMTERGYFFFYAALTACAGIYLYTFFPETKGRSLEQVEEYFEEIEWEKQRKKDERAAQLAAAKIAKKVEEGTEMRRRI